jgi:hypothetical protein
VSLDPVGFDLWMTRESPPVRPAARRVVGRVVGLDDLIRMKRASGRPQDLPDIANLSPPPERDR